jgi:exonuclease III
VTSLSLRSHFLSGKQVHAELACPKAALLCQLMVEDQLDVMCIQEHRANLEETTTLEARSGHQIVLHPTEHQFNVGGVGWIFSPAIKAKVKVNKISHRISVARVDANPPWYIVGIYRPTSVATAEEIDTFDNQYRTACMQKPLSHILITLGDFNAPLLTYASKSQTSRPQKATGSPAKKLSYLLSSISSASVACIRQPKNINTFTSPNGKWRKQLDHITIHTRYATAVKNVTHQPAPFPNLHKCVIASLRIKWNTHIQQQQQKNPPNYKMLTIPGYRRKFDAAIIAANPQSWSAFTTECQKASEKILVWPNTLTNLAWIRICEATHNIPRQAMSPQATKDPTITLPATPEQMNEHQQGIITHAAMKFANTAHRQPAKAWRELQQMLFFHPVEKLRGRGTTPEERLNSIHQYYTNDNAPPQILCSPRFQRLNTKPTFNDDPPTIREVAETLFAMPPNKAPGSDGIGCRVLRSYELLPIITRIIQRIWTTERLPDEWYEIRTVPIPKKGDLTLYENWRPLCLPQVALKVYHKILCKRLLPIEHNLRHNQAGFRPGRSTDEQICAVKQILSEARRRTGTLAVCFVDFKKAFPSISFESIRAALRAHNISDKLMRMVMLAYERPTSFCCTADGNTQQFPIAKGVLQGDTIAPFLFICVLDCILRASVDNCPTGGINIGTPASKGTKSRPLINSKLRLCDLAFADDVILMAERHEDLELLLRRFASVAKKCNLEINISPSKTAWMHIGPATTANITLNGTTVPRVTRYKYLGAELRDEENDDAIGKRAAACWLGALKFQGIWRAPIPTSVKTTLANALVMACFAYASSSWIMRIKDRDKINAIQRQILSFTNNTPIGTPQTFLLRHTQHLSSILIERRAALFGHALRRNCPLTMALQWKPSSKRKQGHQVRTLAEDVCLSLNIDIEELSSANALTRQKWKRWQQQAAEKEEERRWENLHQDWMKRRKEKERIWTNHILEEIALLHPVTQ